MGDDVAGMGLLDCRAGARAKCHPEHSLSLDAKRGFHRPRANRVAFCGQLHRGVGNLETPAWRLARLGLGSKAYLQS